MYYTKKIKTSIIGIAIIFLGISTNLYAQEYTLDAQKSSLIIYGTSNIHDWEIDAENQTGILAIETANKLQIKKLNIVLEVEGLKSGKGGMDKNTYKALNLKKHTTIEFQFLNTEEVSELKNGSYTFKTKGNLKISGVTKMISLEFILNKKDDEVKLVGEKTIKMTDFNVDPPKALLGTIKTGDEVTIKFNTILE
ncbi:hypothetical protein BW723_00290 [Polaribacter reichenbachii]|uniref:Lipid/polyisoprenoid-binding YceI-like domain-containing protein n=1 Tax=Polaribacter reichenbachii TaxID=996801 RepID=A0A1B8U2A4_9FLAO|nr:YceI family protein [Polaribacter reichenbachii]APZ44820.1 hypothetical protein BW723_00290 [Polaribacter reichenbachii]AUC18684.1 hypothetical protein BTO17_08295 [Polaribacter reichenbachii]OBY66013.1 hypothetical protein LPB301_07510 [Polaribacter reichenbachii]